MHKTARFLACALSATLAAAVARPALAQEAAPPAEPAAAPAAAASAEHPDRGMHMSAVEARFGAPAQRYPAVGQPPITRWDYPGFVVYFENDLVLHAVVLGAGG
ncbi:MAG: hypothetical protein JSR54_18340 [Proteobacteria bacterium]|nr:hypothetical protein [Pseudomonadota bacterium]